METIAQEAGNDQLLNPVAQAATIAWRLRKLPTTSDSTEIYHFFQDQALSKITQTEALDYSRSFYP